MTNENMCCWTKDNPGKTKGSMGQYYPYSIIRERNIGLILHIYADRAIFLLFCVNQDTESELCEIYFIIYQPIVSQKAY